MKQFYSRLVGMKVQRTIMIILSRSLNSNIRIYFYHVERESHWRFFLGSDMIERIFKRPIWPFWGEETGDKWGKRQWNNTEVFTQKSTLLASLFSENYSHITSESPSLLPFAQVVACSLRSLSSLLTRCYFAPSSTIAQLSNSPFATIPAPQT